MTKTMWPTTFDKARNLLLIGFGFGIVCGIGVMLVVNTWL